MRRGAKHAESSYVFQLWESEIGLGKPHTSEAVLTMHTIEHPTEVLDSGIKGRTIALDF